MRASKCALVFFLVAGACQSALASKSKVVSRDGDAKIERSGVILVHIRLLLPPPNHEKQFGQIKTESNELAAYPLGVKTDGNIDLPLIDEPVAISGLSVRQAENKIEALYRSRDILLDPHVRIAIDPGKGR